MQITHIASFLVPSGKGMKKKPVVKGIMLHPTGELYSTLGNVFDRSEKECDIPIRFVMAKDGTQNNKMRKLILAFIEKPLINKGKAIAKQLRDCTPQKSGAALFFIILGEEEAHLEGGAKLKKIVLSRFPANQGMLAEPLRNTLKVNFIKRIFIKNTETYKAALYQDTSLEGGFWKGSVVDKQANDIANYWIKDFLESNFESTSMAGTRRLATAIREASKKADSLDVKKELLAFATLAHGSAGQAISIDGMAGNYNLSKDARALITSQLPYPALANDVFVLDGAEFSKSVAYSSIELDNGGILSAPPDKFDSCFHRKSLNHDPNYVSFTTVGRIVDERIKGRK